MSQDSRPAGPRIATWIPVAVAVAVAAFLLIAGALFALATHYEVVDKGKLLPYTSGLIYEIRFFDSINVYVEPENRVTPDTVNVFLLTGLAFISLTFAVLLASLGERLETGLFAIMFFGMLFLAADEFLGIHESMGHNMRFLAKIPFVHRPDDVLVLLYAIPAAVFLFVFRKSLMAARTGLVLMAAAAVCFVLAALADMASIPIEEPLEVVVTVLIVASVMTLGLHHTHRAMRERANSEDPAG